MPALAFDRLPFSPDSAVDFSATEPIFLKITPTHLSYRSFFCNFGVSCSTRGPPFDGTQPTAHIDHVLLHMLLPGLFFWWPAPHLRKRTRTRSTAHALVMLCLPKMCKILASPHGPSRGRSFSPCTWSVPLLSCHISPVYVPFRPSAKLRTRRHLFGGFSHLFHASE